MSELLHDIVLLVREGGLPTKEEIMNMTEEEKEILDRHQSEIIFLFRQQAIAEVTIQKRKLINLNKKVIELKASLEKRSPSTSSSPPAKKKLKQDWKSSTVKSNSPRNSTDSAKQLSKTKRQPKIPLISPNKSIDLIKEKKAQPSIQNNNKSGSSNLKTLNRRSIDRNIQIKIKQNEKNKSPSLNKKKSD